MCDPKWSRKLIPEPAHENHNFLYAVSIGTRRKTDDSQGFHSRCGEALIIFSSKSQFRAIDVDENDLLPLLATVPQRQFVAPNIPRPLT